MSTKIGDEFLGLIRQGAETNASAIQQRKLAEEAELRAWLDATIDSIRKQLRDAVEEVSFGRVGGPELNPEEFYRFTSLGRELDIADLPRYTTFHVIRDCRGRYAAKMLASDLGSLLHKAQD